MIFILSLFFRLKLLEKKKTEMALKSRKEIADYIQIGKPERAKIRVEHIIREDYLVEAMEIVEMYCDLLLARFGLIEQMKNLDDGLAEAISSLIWVSPRLQADVQELKTVSDQLVAKYGKPYGLACRENSVATVSEKLMHKMSVQAPPKLTVEKYIIEIAKYYNVEYEPDPQVMGQDETYGVDALADLGPAPPLINKNDLENNGGPGPGGPGAGSGVAEVEDSLNNLLRTLHLLLGQCLLLILITSKVIRDILHKGLQQVHPFQTLQVFIFTFKKRKKLCLM